MQQKVRYINLIFYNIQCSSKVEIVVIYKRKALFVPLYLCVTKNKYKCYEWSLISKSFAGNYY